MTGNGVKHVCGITHHSNYYMHISNYCTTTCDVVQTTGIVCVCSAHVHARFLLTGHTTLAYMHFLSGYLHSIWTEKYWSHWTQQLLAKEVSLRKCSIIGHICRGETHQCSNTAWLSKFLHLHIFFFFSPTHYYKVVIVWSKNFKEV